MKIEKIEIEKFQPKFKNKILIKIYNFFIMPFIIILFILVFVPILLISNFFSKKKPEEKIEHKFFENEKFEFVKEDIDYNSNNEIDLVAIEFMDNVSEFGDEFWIFKLKAKKQETIIENYPLTNFRIENDNEIITQRIIKQNENITSEIISFSKSTGQITPIKEIGLFNLEKYNNLTKEISGFNYITEDSININVSNINEYIKI